MSVVTLTVTEYDFDHLHESAMAWGKDWISQKTRFTDKPLFTWSMGYWVGSSWVNVMLCQAYLSSRNEESQTVFDMAINSWLILTNYKTELWRNENV